jgi:hypothetical protein
MLVEAEIKMDHPGVRRVLGVGGPAYSMVKSKRLCIQRSPFSDFMKEKAITSKTVLAKKFRLKLWTSPDIDDLRSSSSFDSSGELTSI